MEPCSFRPNPRMNRPASVYSHQRTPSVGPDGKWLRGDVICAKDTKQPIFPQQSAQYVPTQYRFHHNNTRFRGRRRVNGYHNNYRHQMTFNSMNVRSMWNASVPHGLHYCGRGADATEDGFIDDTFLTDYDQYDLYRAETEKCMYPLFSDEKREAPTGNLTECTDSPSTNGIPQMSSRSPGTEHVANSKQPAMLDPANTLVNEENHVSGRFYGDNFAKKELSTPVDYLTLVWDVSNQEDGEQNQATTAITVPNT